MTVALRDSTWIHKMSRLGFEVSMIGSTKLQWAYTVQHIPQNTSAQPPPYIAFQNSLPEWELEPSTGEKHEGQGSGSTMCYWLVPFP